MSDSHSAMAAELADERQRSARLREALQKVETQAKHALSLCRCGHIPTFTCEALGLLASAALAGGEQEEVPSHYLCGATRGNLTCSRPAGHLAGINFGAHSDGKETW